MKTLASLLLVGIISMLMLPLSNLVTKDVRPGEVNYLIQDISATIEAVKLKLDDIEKKKFNSVVSSFQDNDYISIAVPTDTFPTDTFPGELDSLLNN